MAAASRRLSIAVAGRLARFAAAPADCGFGRPRRRGVVGGRPVGAGGRPTWPRRPDRNGHLAATGPALTPTPPAAARRYHCFYAAATAAVCSTATAAVCSTATAAVCSTATAAVCSTATAAVCSTATAAVCSNRCSTLTVLILSCHPASAIFFTLVVECRRQTLFCFSRRALFTGAARGAGCYSIAAIDASRRKQNAQNSVSSAGAVVNAGVF